MFGPYFMGNEDCECCTVFNTCSEFIDWLASKTEIEITVVAKKTSFSSCSDAECSAALSGTYILLKSNPMLTGTLCLFEPGKTFTHHYSRTSSCVTDNDDPYLGIAVDFFCSGSILTIRCGHKYQGGCSYPYRKVVTLPATISSLASGLIPADPTGAFSNYCEGDGNMSYAIS
jgi:hypothetical protein